MQLHSLKKWIIPTLLLLSITGNGIFIGIYLWPNWFPSEKMIITVDFVFHPIERISDLDENLSWVEAKDYVMIPSLSNELVGNGEDNSEIGNLYAPEVLRHHGMYLMWYGGQSIEGHDSILFATSGDGMKWAKYGTVVATGNNNHVNDPSVVRVNDTFYMYYSVAPTAELDQIWVAISDNGVKWTIHGPALVAATDASQWDSLKVGRPSVLYQDGLFKMWFDGSQRDSENPSQIAPGSGRHVGYAYSVDGLIWNKWPENPVFNNSGAIDVEYFDGQFICVEESREGILWRTGINETNWELESTFLFQKMNSDFDRYGHVTPFIYIEDGKWLATYTGAATTETWNRNRISVWYPIYTIEFKIGEKIFRPWAISRNLIEWMIPSEYSSQTYNLWLKEGILPNSSYSSTIKLGSTTHYIVDLQQKTLFSTA